MTFLEHDTTTWKWYFCILKNKKVIAWLPLFLEQKRGEKYVLLQGFENECQIVVGVVNTELS